MGQYRDAYYRAKENRAMHQRTRQEVHSNSAYDPSSFAVQLNEAQNRIIDEYQGREIERLEGLMLKEMADEVYQRVMNNIKVDMKVDTSELSKSIADAFNLGLKNVGFK